VFQSDDVLLSVVFMMALQHLPPLLCQPTAQRGADGRSDRAEATVHHPHLSEDVVTVLGLADLSFARVQAGDDAGDVIEVLRQ